MGSLRYILLRAFFLSLRGTRARRAPSHYLSRFLQNISNSISSPYQSQGEWLRLPFTARIERAQFHRARSASKKDGLAAPFISFSGRALHEHRRSSGSIPLTPPPLPPAHAGPRPLSVHRDQPHPRDHRPPFARSSEPPVDSPLAADAESTTQTLDR